MTLVMLFIIRVQITLFEWSTRQVHAPKIICQFLNESDVSLKSCTVQYGNCDGVLAYSSQGNSTLEATNYIALDVDPGRLGCYVVTASSDELTILVEGRITNAGKINYTNLSDSAVAGHKHACSLTLNRNPYADGDCCLRCCTDRIDNNLCNSDVHHSVCHCG